MAIRGRSALEAIFGRLAAFASTLLGTAVVLVALALPGLVAAADPSPSPVIFPQPHYLVFMEGHSTYDGPVVDNAYWLYPYVPKDGKSFVVPDGSGGVYHYVGRVVGGPFSTDTDACPQMIALGIASLETWTTHAGESPLIVDCARFRATPVPSVGLGGAASTVPGSGSTSPATEGEPDNMSLGIAVALIGLLLFGTGLAGSVTGRRPPPALDPATEDFGPGARTDVDTGSHQDDPPRDPCAEQQGALDQASVRGRFLNDLLASSRKYDALLQKEIDVLANLTLPGSVLLDLGFVAGGLSGAAGPKLLATETFWAALGEAVAKDVVKDVAKQGLSSEAIDAANSAGEGGLSAAKQILVTAIKEGLINKTFLGELSPTGPKKVFRDVPSYLEFTKELQGFSDRVAGPIADGVSAVLDLYNGVIDGFILKDKLDHLRSIRDRILDDQADLEIRMEDALAAQTFAADRLAFCHKINSPDWRP
jgi:hypothetical protein